MIRIEILQESEETKTGEGLRSILESLARVAHNLYDEMPIRTERGRLIGRVYIESDVN